MERKKWRLLPDDIDKSTVDVVVVGSGIAGLAAALAIDPAMRVALVSKESIECTSTYRAQGGITAAIGSDDSVELHSQDTLLVGQGACRHDAVGVLVAEAAAGIRFLQEMGVDFDVHDGAVSLAREGGHSRRRVLHYGDYTGRHIVECLYRQALGRGNIIIYCQTVLQELIVDEQLRCCGCLLENRGNRFLVSAGAVVMATGGYAGLFPASTNPVGNCGEGIAAAYRAGAVLADMEFVQFHPTAFRSPRGRSILLTEALRGEGAYIINELGERFLAATSPAAEMAPRDFVSRQITQEMDARPGAGVFLDARHLGAAYLGRRFPQVYALLKNEGIYLDSQPVPILPAAHYSIGGIQTDIWGRSSLRGLYACGEAAATGVHGANRLASNSLLEGVVFGRRVAAALAQDEQRVAGRCFMAPVAAQSLQQAEGLIAQAGRALGVERSGATLKELYSRLQEETACGFSAGPAAVVYLMAEAALLRCESRGTHKRTDFPAAAKSWEGKHVLQQCDKAVMVG